MKKKVSVWIGYKVIFKLNHKTQSRSVKSPSSKANKQTEAMSKWTGEGWHRDEIMFGVLVGLQIVEDRNGQK